MLTPSIVVLCVLCENTLKTLNCQQKQSQPCRESVFVTRQHNIFALI